MNKFGDSAVDGYLWQNWMQEENMMVTTHQIQLILHQKYKLNKNTDEAT